MQLLKFYADWCGPCRVMKPVVEKLAHKHQIPVTEINIDEEDHRSLIKYYGVASIPTLILAREDGREVARFTGANTLARIEAGLNLTSDDDVI